MKWLKELNNEQLQAVLSTEGPLLVLAGAGSGKTRVITYRIAYILKMGLAKPHNILSITFTNKAADEMKERIKNILGDLYQNDMWISTFHSACARILRMESHNIGYDNQFVIYDMSDRDSLIRECYKILNINEDLLNIKYASKKISDLKNNMVLPDDFLQTVQNHKDKLLYEIYYLYNKRLKENNAMDFDDLLLNTVRLFLNNDDILRKYQEKFRYILVDEYQDTNHIQFYLIYLLSKNHQNICVVGDDDQSIYSFRGADIKNILDFENVFPNCKVIKLEQNYRSTKTILTAANNLIKNNTYRKDKTLKTDNPEGKHINIYEAFDENDEANFVCESINNLFKDGTKLSQIAVLYRTNAQSLVFEKGLAALGIPYKLVGAYKFFDRKEIKDIIAFLRVIQNPKDSLSLLRIINIPKRGIGNATIEKIRSLSMQNGISIYELISGQILNQLDKKVQTKLLDFIQLIEYLKDVSHNENVSSLIKIILDKTKYLELLTQSNSEEDQQRIKNIEQLISFAANFEESNEDKSLDNFLNSITLISDFDQENSDERVSLLTIHAAKGLEFSVVFLVGLEEGLFPSVRSYDLNEIEEERRLCYVALTRAKEMLNITYAKYRRNYGKLEYQFVSRFLSEIPKRLISEVKSPIGNNRNLSDNNLFSENQKCNSENPLSQGDIVEHAKFGKGKIINISKDLSEIEVDFEKYGLKRLLLNYANLKRIG
ncbi:ATP-dependent helicase [Caldicellulosiruptoraceae bacterium PP1]